MSMFKVNKAVKDDYWWKRGPDLWINADNIDSFEQMTDRTPGGSQSNAYVKVFMKSGIGHSVYGDVQDFETALRNAMAMKEEAES